MEMDHRKSRREERDHGGSKGRDLERLESYRREGCDQLESKRNDKDSERKEKEKKPYRNDKDREREKDEYRERDKLEGEERPVFGNDDDGYFKSLEKTRRLASKKHHDGAASGPQAVAFSAHSPENQLAENQTGETQGNKVVFTELMEFISGLQFKEDMHKPKGEDVYMYEDKVSKSLDQETKDEPVTRSEHAGPENDIVSDDSMYEVAVGKGLSGALKLLKERGTFKETVELVGRNIDKQKSKLVGIHKNEGPKEIRIERLDEFGNIMTAKEAFRKISHRFHGKAPGKRKQERRMKQNEEELKLKQMKNFDTPSYSVERMREVQARMKTPFIVLTGNPKPGGLSTTHGDTKVEDLLGNKRKGEDSCMPPPKKQTHLKE